MKPDIDFTEEEELLLKALYPLSKGLPNSTSRKIERIEDIVKTGRNEIIKYRKLLKENKARIVSVGAEGNEKFLGYINDRLLLLSRAANLPLFREKTFFDLAIGIRPRLEDVMSDSHLMEVTFGNLYMSASNFNSLNANEAPEELAQKLFDVVRVYEETRAIDGRKGKYRSDPPGRAQLAYAFEMLVEKPNLFDRIKESSDFSVMYGKEGLHYQVKDQRLFDKRGRKTFQSVHLQALYRQQPLCFPEPIRVLVMDCIPAYESVKISNPIMYG
jgi:hypothetical protein